MTPETTTRNKEQRRRRVLAIFMALALLVTGVMATFSGGTFATFTASTSNSGNTFVTGSFHMDNTASGVTVTDVANGLILSMSNMKPTDSTSGTVTIKNSGTIAAAVVLSSSGASGSSTNKLGSYLNLKITEGTTTVYNGALNALTATTLTGTGGASTWASGESHTYTFTVTFPDTTDNTYEGQNTTITFNWNSNS